MDRDQDLAALMVPLILGRHPLQVPVEFQPRPFRQVALVVTGMSNQKTSLQHMVVDGSRAPLLQQASPLL